MKFGFRTPSLTKSLKARTTGKLKRAAKKAIIPNYGKKGMGLINNPKKALYNAVYSKSTIGLDDLINYKNSISVKKVKDENELITNKDKEQLSYKLNNDCNKYRSIICNTTNPQVFFETYSKLVESLKIMQLYEKEVNWIDANPSMMLGETIAIRGKCIKLLIDNIYKEQNNNGKDTYEKLVCFINELDDENKKYLESLIK